jgi:4-amino-4-deoxy-L-arabinose transferase-like glycosyltransferase
MEDCGVARRSPHASGKVLPSVTVADANLTFPASSRFRFPALRKDFVWCGVACAVAALTMFHHLGAGGLIDPDEGRNASIAWEMQQAGTWLVPTYDGLPYLDKPALFFKSVAFSLSLFGHSEFAARLPSALCGIGLLLLVYHFCRREFDSRTGTLAAIILATTPMFIGFARTVIFDMMLALFVCLAIISGYWAERADVAAHARRWSFVAAGAMGLATLVKGPVGFLIPVLVLAVFHRFDGNRGALKRLFAWNNVALFFALVLPWFIGVSLQRHDFPYYGLVRESLLRFTTDEFHRSEPFYFYVPVIFVTMLFWSLFLPQTVRDLWRSRRGWHRAERLLVVWAIVVTLFFSFSRSKLPGYVLTATIALGILIANRCAAAFDEPEGDRLRGGAYALAGLSGAAAICLLAFDLKPELLTAQLADQRNAQLASSLRQVAIPLALGLTGIAVLSTAGLRDGSARLAFLAFVACSALFHVVLVPVLVQDEEQRTDRRVVADIRRIAPGLEVACYRCFPAGIPFYLERPIVVVTNDNGHEIRSNYIQFAMQAPAAWPANLVSVDAFDDWISRRREPFLLLIDESRVSLLPVLAPARHAQANPVAGGRYWALLVPAGGS